MPQPRRRDAHRARVATSWSRRAGLTLVAVAAVALTGCTSGSDDPSATSPAPTTGSSAPSGAAPSGAAPSGPTGAAPAPTGPGTATTAAGQPTGTLPKRPNIVFVLTDDLATNLIQYMPHVRALQQTGTTFTNYTVTDSLCCPSRASIFTGNFPHDTKVFGNVPPTGGFDKFTGRREDHSTFATSLSAVGYRTGFIGKYMNGYHPALPIGYYAPVTRGAYVPPGWSMWNGVDGGGYAGYRYIMAYGSNARRYGSAPQDFFTTVVQQRATDFLRGSARSGNPFMLEVATYAPHQPATPAPQDVNTFAGLKAPHFPTFDRKPTDPPTWLAGHASLGPGPHTYIDKLFEKRVESLQSVDRMIAAIQRTLVETGEADNTIFVFSSDNGFHLGDYTLRAGKQTAFDIDIRVPLIVSGPGVRAGAISDVMAQNIDLRPTFDALAGTVTPPGVDGHSLVPVLTGKATAWRSLALVEHVRDDYQPGDPDHQLGDDGVPPTYNAMRAKDFLYVRYADGDREYYDLRTDPWELHNLGHRLTPARRAELDSWLDTLIRCHGGAQCWAAGRPAATA